MAKRETVAQAHQRGYDEGYRVGAHEMQKQMDKKFDARRIQLEALEAVTKLISQAGQAIGALSNVYDNGPRP